MMWVRRPRTKGHGAAAAQYFREACLQLARPPTRGADSLACADCSSVLDNVEEDYDEPVLTIEGLLTADSSATTLTLTPTPTSRGENEVCPRSTDGPHQARISTASTEEHKRPRGRGRKGHF